MLCHLENESRNSDYNNIVQKELVMQGLIRQLSYGHNVEPQSRAVRDCSYMYV